MIPENNWEKLTIGLLIAVMFIVGFNAFELNKMMDGSMVLSENSNNNAESGSNDMDMGGESMNGVSEARLAGDGPDVIPKGIPDIYGKELGINFDDISSVDPQKADAIIKKIGMLDQQITLKGDDLKRYIDIAGMISCEYCCGTDSIIFPDGKAACGCAHSFAMRGLAKYLIKNHGSEYSNDQILEEMGKLKTLFFPGKITDKAKVLQSKGIELNYINLASNKYRNIENNV